MQTVWPNSTLLAAQLDILIMMSVVTDNGLDQIQSWKVHLTNLVVRGYSHKTITCLQF